jgi:hypothetical protein
MPALPPPAAAAGLAMRQPESCYSPSPFEDDGVKIAEPIHPGLKRLLDDAVLMGLRQHRAAFAQAA